MHKRFMWYNEANMSLDPKLINRINNTSLSDVVHNGSFAKAERENRLGALGNDTFERRKQIEQNRQHVRAYKHSAVAMSGGMRERSQSQEDALAAMEAQIAKSEAENSRDKRQEMIVRQEKGGLRKYDTRERGKAEINATGRASGGGYGRTSSAEMRQAAAERFAGKAHPIPKSGGFGLH